MKGTDDMASMTQYNPQSMASAQPTPAEQQLVKAAVEGDPYARNELISRLRFGKDQPPTAAKPSPKGYGSVIDPAIAGKFLNQFSAGQVPAPALLVENGSIINYDGPTSFPLSRQELADVLTNHMAARGAADQLRIAAAASPLTLAAAAGRRHTGFGFEIEINSPADSSNPAITLVLTYFDSELVSRVINMVVQPDMGGRRMTIKLIAGRTAVNGVSWPSNVTHHNAYVITATGVAETVTTCTLAFTGAAANTNLALELLGGSAPATRVALAQFLLAATPV
jgi:hypothetical protein